MKSIQILPRSHQLGTVIVLNTTIKYTPLLHTFVANNLDYSIQKKHRYVVHGKKFNRGRKYPIAAVYVVAPIL